VTDGLQSGQRVATTGAFELFKLDPEVLAKTKVQIARQGRRRAGGIRSGSAFRYVPSPPTNAPTTTGSPVTPNRSSS